MTENLIKVLLVDDDPLVLSSIEQYFSITSRIEVAATTNSGAEALEFLNNHAVDVVLADIHMPLMDGVTLLSEVMDRPNPPIFIAITALDRDDVMLKILQSGGSGYVLKSQRPQEIIKAVFDAVEGGTIVAPHALNRLVQYLPQTGSAGSANSGSLNSGSFWVPGFEKITKTERDILELLCRGMSNVQIANELHYAQSTVKKHISNIMLVFDAKTRLELVTKVLNPEHTV
ncbi:two component transcriptional regulator, LuxR family [Corynebacterium mustelae]|uniref:Two component transcriptional regulator, LuxR family n=1 Tax=Corynebacterium mustelae TaxID=571915 RepID=A0A0G3H7M7_9CORY|nr:response regulator transcription factor [Corynebacterium mustelae]AKK07117.1 two component transcriptional regulator, LuxR family [Corynebacterium mustelae]